MCGCCCVLQFGLLGVDAVGDDDVDADDDDGADGGIKPFIQLHGYGSWSWMHACTSGVLSAHTHACTRN